MSEVNYLVTEEEAMGVGLIAAARLTPVRNADGLTEEQAGVLRDLITAAANGTQWGQEKLNKVAVVFDATCSTPATFASEQADTGKLSEAQMKGLANASRLCDLAGEKEAAEVLASIAMAFGPEAFEDETDEMTFTSIAKAAYGEPKVVKIAWWERTGEWRPSKEGEVYEHPVMGPVICDNPIDEPNRWILRKVSDK